MILRSSTKTSKSKVKLESIVSDAHYQWFFLLCRNDFNIYQHRLCYSRAVCLRSIQKEIQELKKKSIYFITI
jgi:hypothetical protein